MRYGALVVLLAGVFFAAAPRVHGAEVPVVGSDTYGQTVTVTAGQTVTAAEGRRAARRLRRILRRGGALGAIPEGFTSGYCDVWTWPRGTCPRTPTVTRCPVERWSFETSFPDGRPLAIRLAPSDGTYRFQRCWEAAFIQRFICFEEQCQGRHPAPCSAFPPASGVCRGYVR